MTEKAIIVEKLEKSYGQTTVVKAISFSVAKGEIFGFLGPNGAGKTTTIRMMIGEIPFSQGSIQIFGHSIPQQIKQTKSLIGVVPDHQNLYDRITVRQNLDFFAALNSINIKRVDTVLEEVFMTEHQHKACNDLSRGLRQRTLIARALLHQPSLFFLDEPTSALDPHSAKLIRELVKKLKNSGTTIFLTTHYMEEADNLCDRLAIMNLGTIVACDEPEKLKKKFGRKTAMLEYTSKEGLKKEEISLASESGRQQICNIINSENLVKMHTREATLEEVFMHTTGNRWTVDSDPEE
ncbi:MAG: ABC transporter ATP-binding protein [Erysipelotrichia bacterium]|nr:ABC transporter ATP-binding protein [Erysipelotrichia bacterium]